MIRQGRGNDERSCVWAHSFVLRNETLRLEIPTYDLAWLGGWTNLIRHLEGAPRGVGSLAMLVREPAPGCGCVSALSLSISLSLYVSLSLSIALSLSLSLSMYLSLSLAHRQYYLTANTAGCGCISANLIQVGYSESLVRCACMRTWGDSRQLGRAQVHTYTTTFIRVNLFCFIIEKVSGEKFEISLAIVKEK